MIDNPQYVRVVFAVTTCDRDACEGWGCEKDEGFWTYGRWKREKQYTYEVPSGLNVELGDTVLAEGPSLSLPTVVGIGKGEGGPWAWPGPYEKIIDVVGHNDLEVC